MKPTQNIHTHSSAFTSLPHPQTCPSPNTEPRRGYLGLFPWELHYHLSFPQPSLLYHLAQIRGYIFSLTSVAEGCQVWLRGREMWPVFPNTNATRKAHREAPEMNSLYGAKKKGYLTTTQLVFAHISRKEKEIPLQTQALSIFGLQFSK